MNDRQRAQGAARQRAYHERARKAGRVRGEYLASPAEHLILKQTLQAMRNAKK